VLVGLPARGKTYIGQKISRYLRWLGVPTRIFNVGDYRRKHFGAVHKHDFFDTKNEGATKMRLQAAEHALQDMIEYVYLFIFIFFYYVNIEENTYNFIINGREMFERKEMLTLNSNFNFNFFFFFFFFFLY